MPVHKSNSCCLALAIDEDGIGKECVGSGGGGGCGEIVVFGSEEWLDELIKDGGRHGHIRSPANHNPSIIKVLNEGNAVVGDGVEAKRDAATGWLVVRITNQHQIGGEWGDGSIGTFLLLEDDVCFGKVPRWTEGWGNGRENERFGYGWGSRGGGNFWHGFSFGRFLAGRHGEQAP